MKKARKKVRLMDHAADLKKRLKDPGFRRAYEYERAMVGLAQKIAELRDGLHLKQAELAARLGVSQQFVSQLETGAARNLTLLTLIKIADAMGRDLLISFPKSHRPELRIR